MKVICIKWVGFLFTVGEVYSLKSGHVLGGDDYVSTLPWDMYDGCFVPCTPLFVALV